MRDLFFIHNIYILYSLFQRFGAADDVEQF